MNSTPLVSVIIPTYNRAHIICEAIESVLAQTYAHIEVLVIDDGSSDDTLQRLKRYGDRIRVTSQANRGPAAARNRGIALSRGQLIAFQDSDDIWLTMKLERQVALLQRAAGSPCCLCNTEMQWEAKRDTSFDISWLKAAANEGVWKNVDKVLATRFVMFNQAVVIRREVLDRIGGFDESIRFLEDYELPLRLSLEGPWAVINEPLVIWRESKTQSVTKNAMNEEICASECMVKVLEAHLARVERIGREAQLRRLVRRELQRARQHLWAVRMGQKGTCGSVLSTSMKTFERYRGALSRRLPWYPKMEVAPVKSSNELRAVPLQGGGEARDSSERLVG